jgi:hypothetical protein
VNCGEEMTSRNLFTPENGVLLAIPAAYSNCSTDFAEAFAWPSIAVAACCII